MMKTLLISWKQSPIPIWEAMGNPWVDFLMVIMASGIARGCKHTTTTTESCNMAAIIQIKAWQRHAASVYCVKVSDIGHPCYDQLTPVKTRNPLTHITWPDCGLNFAVHQDHVFFLSWPLTKCWFSIESQAHVWLSCWKQGRSVRKAVKANPGLKVKTEL